MAKSFSEALAKLMERLRKTEHHYIRCLKPNQTLKAGDWDPDFMFRQLSYSGTLEVTKVRKAGLNVRWPLGRFYEWYKICARDLKRLRAGTQREQCLLLLQQIELDPDTWRVGKTLVFMASENVITELDRIRASRVMDYARFIWFYWVMRKKRDEFQVLRGHVRRIQNFFRGVRKRLAFLELRRKA